MITAKRLKEAMELRGLRQADIVKATGIGKSSVCSYLSGAYEPKQKNIQKLAKALNVSEMWLAGGDAAMERMSYAIASDYPLTENAEKNLATIGFELLDDTDRGIIIGEIRNMLRADKYKNKIESE